MLSHISICMIKTHADIISDFSERSIKGLKEISKRKKFLIFEDRKFGIVLDVLGVISPLTVSRRHW